MTEIFILTMTDCTDSTRDAEDVCGVYSTWEKARDAIYEYIKTTNETMGDMDFNEFDKVYRWYTDRSIWQIEVFNLDFNYF